MTSPLFGCPNTIHSVWEDLRKTNSQIWFEKKDGAAVGVGGRVVFKKTGISVGAEVKVDAEGKEEPVKKIALQFGIEETEARQCFIKNEYSELYFYVDYNGSKSGKYYWTFLNLLTDGLKVQRWSLILRWNKYSLLFKEMVLVISLYEMD